MGGCCLPLHPPHGGPRAVELSIANRRHRCGVLGPRLIARPAKRLKLDTQLWDLKRAMSFHGRETEGMGPWAHRKLFWPPTPCFPHAKFITFGRTEGIGCVPMQNLLPLTELNTLGALCAQGHAWGPGCVVVPVAAHAVWRGQRQCGEGGRGFAEHRVAQGVALAAVLCHSGPAGTTGNCLLREVGPGVDTMTP